MQKLKTISTIVAALGVCSTMVFCIQRNATMQLVSLAVLGGLLLVSLVSICFALLQFKRIGFPAFLPAGICGFGLFVSLLFVPPIASVIRIWNFKRQLPRYTEVVQLVESAEIKISSLLTKIELPPDYSNLAIATMGKTNSSGVLVLEFLTGGGFPVKHSGYLYISGGKIESDPDTLSRWPKHRKLQDKWFAISN